MQIVKGRQGGPVRMLVYGPEKVGKTTFASNWPRPLFVDADRGSRRMDVDRVYPQSWSALIQIVDELTADSKGYRTLVLDTADWLEYLATDFVLSTITTDKGAKVTNIEGYGWGRGYVHLNDTWKKLLDKLAYMQARNGMHVLIVAHSSMKKVELPDETGSFDRWELKCGKQTCCTLKEWPEGVLFLNYETVVVEQDNGRRKAQGGQRMLYAEHHPCWDAGNRFGLPEKMKLPDSGLPPELAKLLQSCGESMAAETKTAELPMGVTPAAAPAPAAAEPTPPAVDKQAAPVDAVDPARAVKIDQLRELMVGDKVTLTQLQAELSRKGIVPADMHPRAYNDATLDRVIGHWSAVVHNIRLHAEKQTTNEGA